MSVILGTSKANDCNIMTSQNSFRQMFMLMLDRPLAEYADRIRKFDKLMPV